MFTTRFAADFRHGPWNMREVLARGAAELDALDPTRAPVRGFAWRGSAFLDTETTSLSSGSGVWVFLTGIGCFEGPEFVVRQYLMRSPAAEVPYLERVAADLGGHDRLVTFFGKAFDQHRLLDRASVQQIELPLPPDHYDLYWLSRRLFRGRFADLKLKTLEREVLRYYRLHDLPGAEAPAAYFHYLRTQAMEGLRGVLEHNLLDIVSLTALAAELSFRMEAPQDPLDRKARGLVRGRGGQVAAACEDLAACLHLLSRAEGLEAARVFQRGGQAALQRQVLTRLVERDARDAEALVELAKWWEHQGKDSRVALEWAERALACSPPRQRPALEHRRRRLQAGASSQRPGCAAAVEPRSSSTQ